MKFLMAFLFCAVIDVVNGQSPFTTGNIIVARIGDGSVALGSRARLVFLDEYTPGGALVQTVALPTAYSGANKKFVLPPNDRSTGSLTRSADGRYLSMFGFDGTAGTFGFVLVDPDTLRTIARIDYNAGINTTSAIPGTDAAGASFGAITNDGTDFWAVDGANGILYTTLGITTSSSSIINSGGFGNLGIANGQLYLTVGGNIYSVGSGLPVTAAAPTILPGAFTNTVPGFMQAFFADLNPGIPGPDVIYVAHDGDYALSKFSLVGGTWVLNGTIGVDADDYRFIDGVVNGTTVTLYTTRKIVIGASGGGELVTLTDASGYNGAFTGTPTVLTTAANQTTLRGVAMAPKPTAVSLSLKAYLQGAYSSVLKRHKDVSPTWASVLNTFALNQPYSAAPFNYTGTESVAPGFFTSTSDTTNILDWVLLELHDATTPATIIARKACFIREDGLVVDLDGVSNPTFPGVGAKNYYIVLRHRNHLAIRSSSTVFVNGATPTTYDFTVNESKAYQNVAITTNAAMKDLGNGIFGMWAGNANSNTSVRASGALSTNDYLYLVNILLGGNVATVATPVYSNGDLNLDGTLRASGSLTNNDYLILVNTLLGGNVANIYTEHQ